MELKDYIEIALFTIAFVFGAVYYTQEKNKGKIKKALEKYPFGKNKNFKNFITVAFLVIAIYFTSRMFIHGFDVTFLKIALSSLYVSILNYLLFKD